MTEDKLNEIRKHIPKIMGGLTCDGRELAEPTTLCPYASTNRSGKRR